MWILLNQFKPLIRKFGIPLVELENTNMSVARLFEDNDSIFRTVENNQTDLVYLSARFFVQYSICEILNYPNVGK